MQRINIIERKIKTVNDLRSIVKTMKGLAAVSINQYEHAVDAIGRYYSSIEYGLQIILGTHPELSHLYKPEKGKDRRKILAIVFGAGQPMCGSFNEVLSVYFRNWQMDLESEHEIKLVAVGSRIMTNLDRYDQAVDHYVEMPITIEHINETVQSLVMAVEQWRAAEGFQEAHLFYNRPEANSSYSPERQQLLPIDADWLQALAREPWGGRSLPYYTMAANELLPALVKQLLFVSVYKAFAESLSAENNSRLVAMQVAEKKIDERLEDLVKSYRSQRQINITEEILDVIASYEVLLEEERAENAKK